MTTLHEVPVDPAIEERERHIEAVLARLDLEGKVRLLSGASAWAIAPNPAIGLQRLVMSDGPVGVRGERGTPDEPAVQLPCPTALAATWDLDLVRRAGQLLAQECRRKSVHVLLAPTVNIHRSPRGGRHFECFSEDPYLTGQIGAAYVLGVQSGGVGVTVKHFVANDSETQRLTVDVRADERTLREIYLAPFEAIVRQSRPWGVMAAYNGVNGATMTEHRELNAILREEWGFDGFIVSDWTAARDTIRCALAGLDVAMPGPTTVYGEHLITTVREGRVPIVAIDAMARRVLRLAARVGALAGAPPAVEVAHLPGHLDGAAIARTAAVQSFTLLRNDNATLPLGRRQISKIAILGLAAAEARTSGGGSITVFPEHKVSPLQGLRAALPAHVEVEYELGADPRTVLAPMPFPLEVVFRDARGHVLASSPLANGHARWAGELPGHVNVDELASLEVRGTFTPANSGVHTFGIAGVGDFAFSIDGRMRYKARQEASDPDPATAFYHPPESRHEVELTGGAPVEVSVVTNAIARAGDAAYVGFSLNYREPMPEPEELIRRAAQAAAAADVAIVVVATTEQVESEGFDRETLTLPGHQDDLVTAAAAANPRTVVVVNAGAPVIMPWRNEVPAILLTWFGGQELGTALAEVILGYAEPGGRLPTTWPAEERDVPVLSVAPIDGRLPYDEGVFVGYRAWQRHRPEPAYWFGHGLGYTTWAYTDLEVRPGHETSLATVRARVTNTGTRVGREVIQVYLAPAEPGAQRPDRWLAGFATVEVAPGESAVVEIGIPRRAAETWDEHRHRWQAIPGAYEILVGRSVADIQLRTSFDLTSP